MDEPITRFSPDAITATSASRTTSGTPAIVRREIFIRQYLIHQNASRAYREAGYKDGPGTRQSAHRLLTKADIQARLAEERQKLLAALDLKVADVVRRFRNIAFADIADIVGLHIGACRFCYGSDHAFHWRTPVEYQATLVKDHHEFASDSNKEAVIYPEGGYGYDANQPPHPDCPMCDGDGIPRVVFKDTRLLTDSERAVLAGIKETRYGINYHFHDQLAALHELAKRVGFYDPVKDRATNAIASLIEELQSRGQIERMPLRLDQEPGG